MENKELKNENVNKKEGEEFFDDCLICQLMKVAKKYC